MALLSTISTVAHMILLIVPSLNWNSRALLWRFSGWSHVEGNDLDVWSSSGMADPTSKHTVRQPRPTGVENTRRERDAGCLSWPMVSYKLQPRVRNSRTASESSSMLRGHSWGHPCIKTFWVHAAELPSLTGARVKTPCIKPSSPLTRIPYNAHLAPF